VVGRQTLCGSEEGSYLRLIDCRLESNNEEDKIASEVAKVAEDGSDQEP